MPLFYVIRRVKSKLEPVSLDGFMEDHVTTKHEDQEPLALMKVNAKEQGDMRLGFPMRGRFGWYVPIERQGSHVFNLMLHEHADELIEPLTSMSGYRLETITKAEWESWAEMELFPVLRLAVAR